MTYLLAKYVLVFTLAALSGFVLGRWLTKRSYVDVSDSYEVLRNSAGRFDQALWSKLWSRLDEISEQREVNLSGVSARLDSLAYAITNLSTPVLKGDGDSASVVAELASLRKEIRGLPVIETHEPIDVEPIRAQIVSLEQRVNAIPRSRPVDLGPINERLAAFETQLNVFARRLSVPPSPKVTSIVSEHTDPATPGTSRDGD